MYCAYEIDSWSAKHIEGTKMKAGSIEPIKKIVFYITIWLFNIAMENHHAN